ncbi:MAG TPA: SDR family NAD(P)-dependent oxidoreductase [Kofleriaceae bacterium]|nr:SDR family NAD(P)-dependent oxidoreductase [Kofleriaceae bacterium]
MERVILVTGASSGIGRACAELLAARGHRVFGTSRKGGEGSSGVTMLAMDVDDDASVAAGVAKVVDLAGRLDVVVNNAGFAIAGAVEDTSVAEARAQFETNVFGVLRVCRAALPHMRAQRSGLIVNISSLGGIFGMPFSGLYSASKFAIEGLSEALALETRRFGVRVVVVEPGDMRTGLPDARRDVAAAAGSAYEPAFRNVMKLSKRDEDKAPDPALVARLVGKIVATGRPKLRYSVGMFSQRIVVWLKRLLPVRMFQWILLKAFELG